MSTESQSAAAPTSRPIVWRGVPLHLVIPATVLLVGVALLLAGGGAAFFGGWWLATALPIAIGGLFRDPRFIAVPAVFWALWLAVGAVAGPDATLANTPVLLAIALAAVGSGAVYVAQRAVFPATDPETLEAAGRAVRTVPTLEDAADTAPVAEPLPVDDGEDLDPALAEAIEVAEETEPEAVLAAEEPESEAAPEPEPAPEPEAEATPASDAEPAPKSEAAPEPEALDEGGHVEEFPAISEADLAKADADAPLPAETRAGKRQSA